MTPFWEPTHEAHPSAWPPSMAASLIPPLTHLISPQSRVSFLLGELGLPFRIGAPFISRPGGSWGLGIINPAWRRGWGHKYSFGRWQLGSLFSLICSQQAGALTPSGPHSHLSSLLRLKGSGEKVFFNHFSIKKTIFMSPTSCCDLNLWEIGLHPRTEVDFQNLPSYPLLP